MKVIEFNDDRSIKWCVMELTELNKFKKQHNAKFK